MIGSQNQAFSFRGHGSGIGLGAESAGARMTAKSLGSFFRITELDDRIALAVGTKDSNQDHSKRVY